MNFGSEINLDSSVEVEKEVINILADSSFFEDLEPEARQELVNLLISLMNY